MGPGISGFLYWPPGPVPPLGPGFKGPQGQAHPCNPIINKRFSCKSNASIHHFIKRPSNGGYPLKLAGSAKSLSVGPSGPNKTKTRVRFDTFKKSDLAESLTEKWRGSGSPWNCRTLCKSYWLLFSCYLA